MIDYVYVLWLLLLLMITYINVYICLLVNDNIHDVYICVCLLVNDNIHDVYICVCLLVNDNIHDVYMCMSFS